MITMEQVINNFNKVNNIEELAYNYCMEVWENKKGLLYMIDVTTNSGLVIERSTKRIKLALSGVDYQDYYEESQPNISFDEDLKNLYKKLLSLEPINKDRFYNVFTFLEDLATRDHTKK